MSAPTVIEIIRDGLAARGFDGLCAPGAECGCLLEDLAPCGESPTGCTPGYRGFCTTDEAPGEWAIFRTKEGAMQSIQDERARLLARTDDTAPGAGERANVI